MLCPLPAFRMSRVRQAPADRVAEPAGGFRMVLRHDKEGVWVGYFVPENVLRNYGYEIRNLNCSYSGLCAHTLIGQQEVGPPTSLL